MAVPVVVGLLVLAFSAPLAWMGATPITSACDDAVRPPDELGTIESETSFLPPGVRCVSHFSSGQTLEGTYVTWYELTVAVLLAGSSWLILASILGVIQPRQFMRGATAAGALFAAATVGFFL